RSIGPGRTGAGAPVGPIRRNSLEDQGRGSAAPTSCNVLYGLASPAMRGARGISMAAATVLSAASRPAAMANGLLVVDNITKRFETPEGVVTAVDGVSLSVAPGEFVGVIGPSGCGKSTLFNIIGGLLDGYDGAVRVAGDLVRGPHPAIGMIFQEESTFPWRTVLDNVAFPLEIAGIAKS